jgi:hypothetical protein
MVRKEVSTEHYNETPAAPPFTPDCAVEMNPISDRAARLEERRQKRTVSISCIVLGFGMATFQAFAKALELAVRY